MYWTEYSEHRHSRIMTAHLDGSNYRAIVSGLLYPSGIAVDYKPNFSRIMWTNYDENRISSLDLRSRDHVKHQLRTVARYSGKSPTGIVLHEGKVFWGTYEGKTLRRKTESGTARTVYSGQYGIAQLTVATSYIPPISRQNHCDGQSCVNVCALTPTGYACLP